MVSAQHCPRWLLLGLQEFSHKDKCLRVILIIRQQINVMMESAEVTSGSGPVRRPAPEQMSLHQIAGNL